MTYIVQPGSALARTAAELLERHDTDTDPGAGGRARPDRLLTGHLRPLEVR
ncbi:hypothetical protein AB0H83_38265 [Dactylosporangium sp. NPDC050688]|uniref:hypothetical protein n=1 Tax=Dactylosporangium sp. NPDC050688 TaxID=3157217 RepID=UPI0033C8072C